MGLYYNGVDLSAITQLLEFTRAPVMHHHKLIYVRHRLRVRAVCNPFATSVMHAGGEAAAAGRAALILTPGIRVTATATVRMDWLSGSTRAETGRRGS